MKTVVKSPGSYIFTPASIGNPSRMVGLDPYLEDPGRVQRVTLLTRMDSYRRDRSYAEEHSDTKAVGYSCHRPNDEPKKVGLHRSHTNNLHCPS